MKSGHTFMEMSFGPSPTGKEEWLLEGLLQWIRSRPDCQEPAPDAFFRCMNPAWIRRFALRDELFPWVREYTGLPTFYPDELDASSTPRTLAGHLARRVKSGTEPTVRPPVIPFREDPVREPTVFVLTCPRSGSTLFRCMLMGHPSLFAPPELHLADFFTMRERERKITDSGLYWKTMGLVQTIAHLTGWNKWQAFHYLSHLTKRDLPVKEVYKLIHALCPKPVVVDKSPSLTRQIGTLQRIEQDFANPKYLFITRHPHAVIESLTRQPVYPPSRKYTFASAEERWLEANRNVLRFLENVPEERWHRFCFEDLMADTEQTLRGVTDFLKIPYCPSMADAYQGGRMQSGIGCINLPKRKAVQKELGEKWKHVRLPGPLGAETAAIAAKLGYTCATT